MKSIGLALQALAIFAPGCVGGDTRVYDMPPMYRPIVPLSIHLAPYDPQRLDRIYTFKGKPSMWGSMLTGPYWTDVFTDDPSLGIVFELENTKMEMEDRFIGRFAYHVNGTFRCDEKLMIVKEIYRRKSQSKDLDEAFAVVVNDALIDLAKKGLEFAVECNETDGETGAKRRQDKYADLQRLKELLDDGTLTQEEFDREKAKILNE